MLAGRGRGTLPAMSKRPLVLVLAALLACGGKSAPTSTVPGPVATGGGGAGSAVTGMPATSPATDPDAAPLPLWSAVKKGTLPNGLTYYILPHHKPEKRAFLWLAVNAGSVQEDDDQRGLAHFDEHMAFNGTKRFPKDAIVKYLETIGMRFGADLNAYTTWDQTVYQLEVPSDKPEFMQKGLDILRDWAGDVSYDPEEVAKERGVVLEEWRLGRGANTRLFDKHSKVLFKGSRYAERITIGQPEIIQKAPRDTLYRFYKDWYRPDLMAVIAVGDFDPAAMEKEITQRFGDLKAPAKERARPSGGMPEATGTRVSIETDREATGTVISIENLVGHRPESSRKDYRRIVAEQLYGIILNERLASLARKPDAPFIAAFGGIESVVRTVDAFQRFAQAKSGKVEETLRALMTEVVRIEKHGITDSELERARTNMARQMEEQATTEETTDSRQFTDEITRNFFEDELMIGRKAEHELTMKILPTVTVAELNELVSKFGGADNRVVLISGPDGKPLPDQKRVLQIVDEVQKSDVPAWEDKAPSQALMPKLPTPGKIVKEKTVDKIGVTEWTLSNGVRVIVKPTDFEQDTVLINATSPGGEATAKDKDYPSIRFADELASIGGVGQFDADTLQKMLAGKQVQVSAAIGETTEGINANGSVRDLETMMQLIHLEMTAPRKDEQQFAVWKQNTTEELQNAQRNPEYQFQRESLKAEYKDNPRRNLPGPDDIAKVNLDTALAFYKDRFGDASDFTFVIVGAVKTDQLKPLVETYLASLPAKGRHEKEKDLGIRKVGGVVKKEWKVGQEPKASVRIEMHGDDTWSRDKDRDMFILGQVLSIKLREEMREEKGGVYGVGAFGSIQRSPHQERSFQIRFGCDPKRVDELVKTALDESAALAKDGADDDHLTRVKETFVRTRETELRQNRFWSGWLANAYRFGDDPTIVLDLDQVTKRMTSANVKAAAKRYLDQKGLFQAELLPEK
jgi:zinc protease